MSSVVIAGNTSGTVTLNAPDIAGTTVLTLPTTSGTLVTTAGGTTVPFALGSAASPSITFTGDTNTGIFSPGADTIAFAEGGAEIARFDSSGNLGVGTTSPVANRKITVSNTGGVTAMRINAPTGYDSFLELTENNSTSADTYWQINKIRTTNELQFWNGAERMRIDSSGNLLVGTTSVIGKITVVGGNQPGMYLSNTNTNDLIDVRGNQGGSSGTGMYVMPMRFGDSTFRGGIYWNGSVVQYLTSSDYRLKENIAPMTGALAKVAQLKPVTYTWKESGVQSQGFIAHELQEVVPECVTGEKDAVEEDGSIKAQGIDTSFLVATLTAAIQEQQAIITDLKARIEVLENK
jgi:hypothetical protein